MVIEIQWFWGRDSHLTHLTAYSFSVWTEWRVESDSLVQFFSDGGTFVRFKRK